MWKAGSPSEGTLTNRKQNKKKNMLEAGSVMAAWWSLKEKATFVLLFS
jgi:hypothetical protein